MQLAARRRELVGGARRALGPAGRPPHQAAERRVVELQCDAAARRGGRGRLWLLGAVREQALLGRRAEQFGTEAHAARLALGRVGLEGWRAGLRRRGGRGGRRASGGDKEKE